MPSLKRTAKAFEKFEMLGKRHMISFLFVVLASYKKMSCFFFCLLYPTQPYPTLPQPYLTLPTYPSSWFELRRLPLKPLPKWKARGLSSFVVCRVFQVELVDFYHRIPGLYPSGNQHISPWDFRQIIFKSVLGRSMGQGRYIYLLICHKNQPNAGLAYGAWIFL